MSDDKTHEATQQKLDKARKEGDMGLSAEGLSFVTLIILVLMVIGPMSGILLDLAIFMQQAAYQLQKAKANAQFDLPLFQVVAIFRDFVLWMLFLPLAVCVTALAQRKFRFTPKKLKLNFKNLNPVSNLGKKFQAKALLSFAINIIKSIALSVLIFVMALLPAVKFPLLDDVGQGLAIARSMMVDIFVAAIVVFAISACFDIMLQRADLKKRNRMSHQEIKDEQKDAEGDPHTKQRRRELSRSIGQGDLRQAVEKGDVIIVNPVHYAVILHWQRGAGSTPTCLDKGSEHRALKIKELAKELGTPIYVDPPTARLLYRVTPIGGEIPAESFAMVAAAYRYVARLEERHKTQGSKI